MIFLYRKRKKKKKGMVSFWPSYMSVRDEPHIFVTDLILLSYREDAQMFLSPCINVANI